MVEDRLMINPLRPMNNIDYVIDDIIQPVMGKRLDTTRGNLDYEWEDKCVSMSENVDYTKIIDWLHWGYQIYHRIKLNGSCLPHVHWFQNSSDVPNWLIRYRFHKHGEEPGAWIEQPLAGLAKTYVTGKTKFLNISYLMDEIDLSSEGLGVSDFFDVQLIRDINNSSGLFSGNDPIADKVLIKGFDPHFQIDAAGSIGHFIK